MPPALDPSAVPPATQGAQRTVLSIEDEPFISELYARALIKAGYQVTIEHDGQKGLELAKTDRYDIILLDLLLPSLTGTEILHKLKDAEETPHVHSKIIITTNFEERKEIRAEIEKQADAYLIKVDVTPNQLVEFLNQIK
jgi:CheY-like chemotaxis protein